MSPSSRVATAGAGLSAALVVGMFGSAVAFADPDRADVFDQEHPQRVADSEPADDVESEAGTPQTTPPVAIGHGRLVRLP